MQSPLVPKRRAGFAHSVDGDGLQLLDASGEHLVSLDDIGAAVWLLVDGARSSDEIAWIVRGVLSVDPSQAHEAVESLLRTLASRGLIELVT